MGPGFPTRAIQYIQYLVRKGKVFWGGGEILQVRVGVGVGGPGSSRPILYCTNCMKSYIKAET